MVQTPKSNSLLNSGMAIHSSFSCFDVFPVLIFCRDRMFIGTWHLPSSVLAFDGQRAGDRTGKKVGGNGIWRAFAGRKTY